MIRTSIAEFEIIRPGRFGPVFLWVGFADVRSWGVRRESAWSQSFARLQRRVTSENFTTKPTAVVGFFDFLRRKPAVRERIKKIFSKIWSNLWAGADVENS